MRRLAVGLLLLLSALALVLSSTSLWLRHNVINTDVFVGNVQTMVDLPEVEARINDRVTTTVMDNPDVQDAVGGAVEALPPRLQRFQPTVETGIRSLVSAGVQRLLTNDPFRPLTTAALTTAHDQLVSGQPVEFTLGMAKQRVPDSLQDGLTGQVLDLLPDDRGVTLLSPSDSPQVYDAVDILKSAWWWLGLVFLGTLAGALGVSRRRRGTLRAMAVTTTVLALLVLVALRAGRSLLLPQARPENRDAVGAVYDVLAGSLRGWTLWLLAAALLVLVLTLVWGRTGLVAGVRRATAAARQHVRERREARGPAAEGQPAAEREPWPRRAAAWSRAFGDELDLPARTAALGTAVRDHFGPVRWTGIAVGALVLLFWPSPTLSVLVWIGALVALYLGALEWLRNRAPEPAAAVPAATAAVAVPTARQPLPDAGRADLLDGAPAERPQQPEPLIPEQLTPQAISTLSGRLDLLVRLGAAHDSGVLTDDEFRREKERLLGA